MIPGKYSGLVTCVAAAGIGMFVAMWLLDFAVVRAGWCISSPTEDTAVCAREWIGALSGWAAALAAGLAIFPIYEQLKEHRRQTSFSLGDAKHTVDIERMAYLSLRIRIVNWNRRTLSVRPIKYYISGQEINAKSIKRETESEPQSASNSYGFKIQGWEDRSKRPPFSEFYIELDGTKIDQRVHNEPITIEIISTIIGEQSKNSHEKITVNSWGKPFF